MKKLKNVVAAIVTTGILSSLTTPALAEPLNFSKPTYIYGAGLSQDEIRRTAEYLGIQSLNNITMDKVTGAELDFYIGNPGSYTTDGEMISSVVVAKAKPGTGLDVNITTPRNITQIKKYQYENACITAGINDVYVNVGAIRPVTGESALAGIYKALEVNNMTLDKKRMEVAQKELEITNKIIQNNTQINNTQINNITNQNTNVNGDNNKVTVNPIKTAPGTTSPKKDNKETTVETTVENKENTTSTNAQQSVEVNNQIVNELIISIKTDVGEKAQEAAKDNKEAGLTKEEVEAIIDAKLKELNLDKTVTDEVKEELSAVMVDYSKTEAAKSEDVQKQLENLDKKVKEDPNQVKTNSENPIAITVPEEVKETTVESKETTLESSVPVVPGTEATVDNKETTVESTAVDTKADNKETTVETTATEEKVEVTKDGFVVKRGKKDILADKTKAVLVNFPEDMNYVLLTLPEAINTKVTYNKDKASRIIENPYNKPYIPMNNDFIANYKPGFSADYFAENGTKYVYGQEMEVKGQDISLLHVRSEIKTHSEDDNRLLEAPTLETFATAVYSTFLSDLDGNMVETPGVISRSYIFALSEEIKGDENTTGVFDLGDYTMVLSFNEGMANAYFVNNKTGAKVDYNSMNDAYGERSLTSEGKVVEGLDNQPVETTVEETTIEETSIENTGVEETSVEVIQTSEEVETSVEVKPTTKAQ